MVKNLINKLFCLGSRKKAIKKENTELKEQKKVSGSSFRQEEEIAEEIIETSTKINNSQKASLNLENNSQDSEEVGEAESSINNVNQGNAQAWLNSNYPKNGTCCRIVTGTKSVRDRYAYGGGYPNSWKTIIVSHKDKNYGKKREEVAHLDISGENLTGTLDLSSFINLKEVNHKNNQLTNLFLPVNNQIEELNCHNNQLTVFPINLNPETLTKLIILSNNFESDLTIFSKLVNLETLHIGKNQLTGSLAPLASLSKLKDLNIWNTQVDSGLEYLPESLEEFSCRETKLITELEIYGEHRSDSHLLKNWKQTNPNLVTNAQKVIELEKILNNLNSAGNIENETISKGLDIFKLETEEKVRELKKQNREHYQAKIVQVPKS